ncbi:enterochelin esterase [Microbulbifer sp. ANSA003]|uniref:enterochelin esterase n=1 Tax=Microbulbifer sp. ANSA003 TaxID=3243360 RepID=UPI0040417A6C
MESPTIKHGNAMTAVMHSNLLRITQSSVSEIGSALWWSEMERQGLPLVNENPSNKESLILTFLWRDPDGSESHSPIKQVYIDINCVTNHHTFSPPSLVRLPKTDVWYWQLEIEKSWRGSYRLIPATEKWIGSNWEKALHSNDDARKMQRHWWRNLIKDAIPDPLNRQAPSAGSWSKKFSAIHLPGLMEQSLWQEFDLKPEFSELENKSFSDVGEVYWQSSILGIRRRVWTYACGKASDPEQRPLVILLDGDRWAKEMPVFSVLREQTQSGHLPAALYLLVDSVNGKQREQDLTCSEDFWLAIQKELIPQIKEELPHTENPAHTIVAGQSYGGLAAMFAGLKWPARFGCVLSQSGSFWWPNNKLMRKGNNSDDKGWLTDQVLSETYQPGRLKIFQQVGTREYSLTRVNDQLNKALNNKSFDVKYQKFVGGHDTLCWREGLITGLSYLLQNFSYQD